MLYERLEVNVAYIEVNLDCPCREDVYIDAPDWSAFIGFAEEYFGEK